MYIWSVSSGSIYKSVEGASGRRGGQFGGGVVSSDLGGIFFFLDEDCGAISLTFDLLAAGGLLQDCPSVWLIREYEILNKDDQWQVDWSIARDAWIES